MSKKKFYIIKCNKCNNEIKVSPEQYRNKIDKFFCNNCLDKLFKNFKKN